MSNSTCSKLFLISEIDLPFVIYPQALTIASSKAWSFSFFLMFIVMNIDRQFVTVETVKIAVMSMFKRRRSTQLCFLSQLCIIFFIFGIFLETRSGPMLLNVLSHIAEEWMGITLTLSTQVALFSYSTCF